MSELNELYREVILDHNKNPRNYGTLEEPDRKAEGYNPLCGDRLFLSLDLDEEGRIAAVRFTGEGCAISTASASVMSDRIKGMSKEEIDALFENFRGVVMGEGGDEESLGKLRVFAGVSQFPARVKCATLCWHTLQAALSATTDPITTE